jgi:uracil-DNA glycosylase
VKWTSKLGDWEPHLAPILSSKSFRRIQDEIKRYRQLGQTVYPKGEDAFRAFELCQLENTKVVIIGQDPYHNGSATGLAFGVNGTPIPPSLNVIRRELCAQFDHVPEEFDNSLEHWASQGVLLLNTALSVLKGRAASMSQLWQWFTPMVVKLICKHKPGTIFVLWGRHAQSYRKYITHDCIVYTAPHPAAELYSGGKAGFFGNGHFLKINESLDKPIDWFKLPKKATEEEQLKLYM